MTFFKLAAVVALAVGAAACGQGNSDNVMSPQANALTPAEVNEALGPETGNTTDLNASDLAVNDAGTNEVESNHAAPNINDEPDEPGYAPVNNSSK